MSDTLYIQTDMNILIKHPHVYLQDIARLSCSNSKVLNRLRVLPVANLNPRQALYNVCDGSCRSDSEKRTGS